MTRPAVLSPAMRAATIAALAAVLILAGCDRGGGGGGGDGGVSIFGPSRAEQARQPVAEREQQSTVWDLFSRQDTNTTIAVNKYLWNASLEVLDFLPVQTIDPFSGVIVTGYGTPPGGGRSYRATVKISDPALDARALKLALEGPGGSAVAPDTVRAVEDAILTRARQLRLRDGQY